MKAKTTRCINQDISLWLILELLGFSPWKFWQVLVYLSKYLNFLQISSLTPIKELKNSLELPNPARNTCKFANKLMTNTSGKINLQSKQDIIYHLAKVKPAMSAHYVADVIPFLAYIIFPLNPTLHDKARKMYFTPSKKK